MAWRVFIREGTFTHVFRDKLISFTLIHKIDHNVKISEPSLLTESCTSIFWYRHVLSYGPLKFFYVYCYIRVDDEISTSKRSILWNILVSYS